MNATQTNRIDNERRSRLGIVDEPMGYVDGQNLYQYVGSNPVVRLDPLGLESWNRTKGTEAPGGGEVTLANGDKGTVKVWKEVTIEKANFANSGLIQLEFKTNDPKKASCHDAHWVQFVRRELYDLQNNPVNQIFQANNTFRKTGETYLDVIWQDPESIYYDTHGENNHTDTEISIFDAPSYATGRNYSRSVSTFDDYLVVDKKVYWHVHWELVAKPDNNGVWKAEYTNISGGAVNSLGDNAKAKLLVGYSREENGKLSNPIEYDNPL